MSRTRIDRRRPDIHWALTHGWEFDKVTKTGHLRFIHTVTRTKACLAATPSDWRGERNTISRLRQKTALVCA